jgi:hypothetical protein
MLSPVGPSYQAKHVVNFFKYSTVFITKIAVFDWIVFVVIDIKQHKTMSSLIIVQF